jgi:hypothetical protein
MSIQSNTPEARSVTELKRLRLARRWRKFLVRTVYERPAAPITQRKKRTWIHRFYPFTLANHLYRRETHFVYVGLNINILLCLSRLKPRRNVCKLYSCFCRRCGQNRPTDRSELAKQSLQHAIDLNNKDKPSSSSSS